MIFKILVPGLVNPVTKLYENSPYSNIAGVEKHE